MTVKELINILQNVINQNAEVKVNGELYIQSVTMEIDRHGMETDIFIDAE
jgi:hypothetical protein